MTGDSESAPALVGNIASSFLVYGDARDLVESTINLGTGEGSRTLNVLVAGLSLTGLVTTACPECDPFVTVVRTGVRSLARPEPQIPRSCFWPAARMPRLGSGQTRVLKSGVAGVPDESLVLDYAWLEYEVAPPGGFRADALTLAGDLVEGKANDWGGAMFQSVPSARIALRNDLAQIQRFLDDRAASGGRVILMFDKPLTPIVRQAFVEVFADILANPRFRYIDGNL